MSTRSGIVIKDGKNARGIYVHYDGYIKGGVGETLLRHYTNREKVEKLVALGDCSQVADCPNVEPAAGVAHSFNKPADGVVVAYGRDRGEKDVGTRAGTLKEVIENLKDSGAEFVYVFEDDGTWSVVRRRDGGHRVALTDAARLEPDAEG